MSFDRDIETLNYQAHLSEQEATRDFKEAGVLGGIAAVATLIGYEFADKLPNELASEATTKKILVIGTVASATVIVAGMTAGYIRKHEAKEFRKDAAELERRQY